MKEVADINLYLQGNVIVYHGVNSNGSYNSLTGQTHNIKKLTNEILNYSKDNNEIILRSLVSNNNAASKLSLLELIPIAANLLKDNSLTEKGLNIKLIT